MTKTQSIKMKSLVKRLKKYKLLYLVLLVAMAYYFVMLYIPIFWGFELSFKEMKIGSTISGAPWSGPAELQICIQQSGDFQTSEKYAVHQCLSSGLHHDSADSSYHRYF
ncbi:MAG: hypothetical protein ACLR2E_13795 [Lachnospiraceae bacterium]